MTAKLTLESLDHRDLPSLFGVAWPNAATGITFSFANDGTPTAPSQIGSSSPPKSVLNQHLNGSMSTAAWQEQILRAFAVWAAPANINIGVVPDNTRPFGADGAFDSTPAAGEIRIGAMAMSNETGAISSPFNVLAGPRSGDVLINTDVPMNIGGTNGRRDLFTVFMNEAGNVLGLVDNADKGSARYGRYTGVRSGLSTNDYKDIQAMYGARPNDLYDNVTSNNTPATASTVGVTTLGGTLKGISVDGAIPTTADVDVYRLTTPAGSTSLTVNLNTAGKSLFTGTVEVLNASQQVIATRSITSPVQGDIDFSLAATANTTYFLRVKSARTDAFGVGIYTLKAGINGNPKTLAAPASPIPTYGADNYTDDYIDQARILSATTPGYVTGTNYTVHGQLEGWYDWDTYRVTVPVTTKPLTVTVTPEFTSQITPEVRVFRPGYVLVESVVLTQSTDGYWTAQVPGLIPGEQVFLTVANIQERDLYGRYRLNADFTTPLATMTTLVEGNTSTADSRHDFTMSVPESTNFHFRLESRNDWNFGKGDLTELTIRNSQNVIVGRFTNFDKINTAQIFLPSGTYRIEIQGKDEWGGNVGGAWYSLSAARLSDPIDVYDPNDPVTQTPPVVITQPDPLTDWDVYYITNPWSELIG